MWHLYLLYLHLNRLHRHRSSWLRSSCSHFDILAHLRLIDLLLHQLHIIRPITLNVCRVLVNTLIVRLIAGKLHEVVVCAH